MSMRTTRVKAVLVSIGLLVATVSVAAAVPASAAVQGGNPTYIVLYRGGASSADAAATVSNAGGTLVANYSQIGVGIARARVPNVATAAQQHNHSAGRAS